MQLRPRNGAAQQQLKRRIGWSPSPRSISFSPLVMIGSCIVVLMIGTSFFMISMGSLPKPYNHRLLESKTQRVSKTNQKIRHHQTHAPKLHEKTSKTTTTGGSSTSSKSTKSKKTIQGRKTLEAGNRPLKTHNLPKTHLLHHEEGKHRLGHDALKHQQDVSHPQHHHHHDEVKNQDVAVTNDAEQENHVVVRKQPDPSQILKAFLEPIDFASWEVKPLPVRFTATSDQLTEVKYPKLNSCSRLPEQWPTDEYPNADPFLPWIHDVFPTHDGKFIQFVAQNKRRCRTAIADPAEARIMKAMQPQVALFQHVPVKRITSSNETQQQGTRYRLASHDDADSDGMATRFICRFKPSMTETLSVFNFDYDLAAHRKGLKRTFSVEGLDNKNFFTSQLIFQCPVPEELVDIVRTGSSVIDDWATMFLDIVPIRTPPRYETPNAFLPPWYKHMETTNETAKFDANTEWSDQHILPKLEDAGRWENIPICKPSLITYEPQHANTQLAIAAAAAKPEDDEKVHKLVICVWASASFATRGDRYTVNDGQRRLNEWLHYNFLVGFDHIYVYDNSGAFSDELTLAPITDKFGDKVTRIPWPARVCNNRHNTEGERSSQYAAESSCRLRFGPHVEWIGSFDVDEYIVPVGEYTSVLPLLDKLDQEGKKIISFPSFRSWARKEHIEEPEVDKEIQPCWPPGTCFDLRVREDRTFLQAYNCERQKGRKLVAMPAEKQIYRADYVKQHFIHYSTVTEIYMLNITMWNEKFNNSEKWHTRMAVDPLSRFGDELTEATMLHTKAIARQDTAGWPKYCRKEYTGRKYCRVGYPWPEGAQEANITFNEDGWKYNCYINEKIESYWVPRLKEAMQKDGSLQKDGSSLAIERKK